ncbi:hypothetical protein K9N68_35365 (plasmid) [Kovacikia minuta CCNUW1]|uniref:hypothetical protein n=1 Tax=Kovacikia minuta TaxID=2931930 RepID=UPI001CCA1228|nr:hypothetical protein [Kovacikia minuta]UBF30471.1 hypothetical protein K9N68_35365 [Kovacikia minuta CCNUW1]
MDNLEQKNLVQAEANISDELGVEDLEDVAGGGLFGAAVGALVGGAVGFATTGNTDGLKAGLATGAAVGACIPTGVV